MYGGAQQFTTTRLKFRDVKTAINMHWNWAWTLKSLDIDGADVGISFVGTDDEGNDIGVGSAIVMDSKIANTKTPFLIVEPKTDEVKGSTYLVLDNVEIKNCGVGVQIKGGDVLLKDGSTTVQTWTSGKVIQKADSEVGTYVMGEPVSKKPIRAKGLIDRNGAFYERAKPQYEDQPASNFLNVKDFGAKGDGRSDDTKAVQNTLDKGAGKKIVYFPAGTYIVTSTVTIPKGSKVVGEAWSQIMGAGKAFSDMKKPNVVVRVGKQGDVGSVEIQDILFTVKGATAGAVIVEWNIKADKPGSAAMWGMSSF